MTPAIQVAIGMGIGLIAILAVMFNRRERIGYTVENSTHNEHTGYWSVPGERCPICLDDLQSHSMQYLKCGHALHDSCFREYRRTSSLCPTCRAEL